MRDAVRNYLIAKFDGLFNHYSSKIIKFNEKLCKSIDKLIHKYNRKFTKVINARIEREKEMEKSISDEINHISNQIHDIHRILIQY